MLRALYTGPHLTATLDDPSNLVRYVRSAEPYPSLEAVRELHHELNRILATLPPGKLALLVDMRLAPARNDDPFELEVTEAVTAMLPRFTAHAFLVKSAVGRLQVLRLAKSRGDGAMTVFVDEHEALEWLQKGKAP
ncbi:MAG TPA: hypothetical protein VH142_10310 [Polyangiaceae bacterium]|jgi:hypothetical protein|nr:hypothetical protein [Polyangiaceae bacterium]